MDFLKLIVLTKPTGMWESILDAFNKKLGSYIWAVILIAVLIRVVLLVVDVVNKRISYKTAKINEKMQPELEAIQKKYGNDKEKLQQKQQEIYKKYQVGLVGSCLPTLLVTGLQMAIMLTLWNGFRGIANYNTATQYENTKTVYYNVLTINEHDDFKQKLRDSIDAEQTPEIEIEVDLENSKINIKYDGEELAPVVINKNLKNSEIMALIDTYALESEETPLGDIEAYIKKLAGDTTADYFLEHMEGFLWIKNIYKPDSTTSPVFTEKEVLGYVESYYKNGVKNGVFTTQEEADQEYDLESKIFPYVNAGFKDRKVGYNGYYILVIIAVGTSILQMFISNLFAKKSGGAKQPGGKAMYFIMPLIFGLFTLMYTSLFALYIIVGQIVMIILSPLTNYLVKLWTKAAEKKQAKKNLNSAIDVDYRRKDI